MTNRTPIQAIQIPENKAKSLYPWSNTAPDADWGTTSVLPIWG